MRLLVKRLILILLLLGIGIGVFFLFQKNKPVSSDTSKIKVTTSFYPLYFLAKEIGGEKAQVTSLVPSGVEPHDFEPSTRDIASALESKLVLLNGVGLEPWAESLSHEVKKTNTLFIVVGNDIPAIETKKENRSVPDPHMWLSPKNAQLMVKSILKGYQQANPQNAIYYTENAQLLEAKLRALDQEFAETLKTCKTRQFITSHTAFSYLARDYNLTQLAITGVSPEEEPSAQDLANIVTFAKEHQTKYIFFETLVSPKLSQTLAREVGAQTLVLDPLEGISDDKIQQGANYFTVMHENLINLSIALQCQQ